MAYTTVNKSGDYFNTKLYTGNGSTQSINVGFQPDFTWIKTRSGTTGTEGHRLQDAVRGSTKYLESNGTAQEGTQAQGVTSFTSTGFNLGTDGSYNYNTAPIASWNWKANGTGSANTDGSINSTVSVNTTSGFSIVSYTGNATANATVGHGLGVAPSMMIVKKLNGAYNWGIYHKSLTAQKLITFTTGTPDDDASYWNDVEPTSSVFNLGSGALTNGSGSTMIAYCFTDVQGYSKFSSYTGNGNADGTFVYTGFKPAFVMIKRTDTGDNWLIKDIKRDPINQMEKRIFPNLSNAEDTGSGGNYDFLSNGFKLRESDAIGNASGGTYIYMAFAEAPLVGTNNVPCTAR